MRTRISLFVLMSGACVLLACNDAVLRVEPSDGASSGDDDVLHLPDEPDPTSDEPDDDAPDAEPDDFDDPPLDGDEGSACSGDEKSCGGVCTAVTSNDEHCGDCNNVCGEGLHCDGGGCVCDSGRLCGGSCVDTMSDDVHCGDCDQPCPGGEACQSGVCEPIGEVEGVLRSTNEWRAMGADCGTYGQKDAAEPLELDPDLSEAAQVHADDMADNDFFSHTGSDGSSFSTRVARTDYQGFPLGENIAGGGSEPAGVVQRWIDSDGHCRNLMNPSATRLGVGFARGGPYGTMWVQVFGR